LLPGFLRWSEFEFLSAAVIAPLLRGPLVLNRSAVGLQMAHALGFPAFQQLHQFVFFFAVAAWTSRGFGLLFFFVPSLLF